VHDGEGPNFTVDPKNGLSHCHSQCGQGWNILSLEAALSGKSTKEALADVLQIIGRNSSSVGQLGVSDWSMEILTKRIREIEEKGKLRHVTNYYYRGADGNLVWVKCRFVDENGEKTFRSFAITKRGSWRTPRKEGVPPLLYRLPEVLAAEEEDLVNGEEAADAGARLGRVTTCLPTGECNWNPEFTKFLSGKIVNL